MVFGVPNRFKNCDMIACTIEAFSCETVQDEEEKERHNKKERKKERDKGEVL